jgi:hypothetical protein
MAKKRMAFHAQKRSVNVLIGWCTSGVDQLADALAAAVGAGTALNCC